MRFGLLLIRSRSILLVILLPALSAAHPGKTDYRDGHTCLRNCEQWDLAYDEYHLHDRDRNPIRIDRRKVEKLPAPGRQAAEQPGTADQIPQHQSPAVSDAATVKGQKPVVNQDSATQEENLFGVGQLLLLGVAGLLVLLLVALRRTAAED